VFDSTAAIISARPPGRSSIVLDGGSTAAPAAQPDTILMTREKPSSENQTRPRDRSPKIGRARRADSVRRVCSQTPLPVSGPGQNSERDFEHLADVAPAVKRSPKMQRSWATRITAQNTKETH